MPKEKQPKPAKEKQQTLEDYKKYVKNRLESFTPVFLKIAAGDFSAKIEAPDEKDEFAPLVTALNMVLDDLRFLDQENKKKEEKLKQSLERIKKSKEKIQSKSEDVQRSRKALMNILEDVQESKDRAEREKKRTEAIVEKLTDGLLLFNKEDKLILVNSQAEDYFDIKGRDVEGRSFKELETFPTIKPLMELLDRESKKVSKKELSLRQELVLEISTVSLEEEEGKAGVLVILHDITREKRVERMKTEFVSIAAHQLRTPLSAIKWTLKMLLSGDLGEVSSDQKELLDKTYQSNERMINLINDLLDVTRIEEGRYVYKPQYSQLEDVVSFVLKSLKGEFEKKGVELKYDKPEKKLPKVKIDVEKMKVAITNLVDNAIKYTPKGGKVTVRIKSGKKELEVSVRDTGVGIPEDQQDRIFSKFFRSANVMRMDTEGNGLGLFIVKNIIEAHKGKVWFESIEGEGTAFYFALPVKKEFEDFLKKF